MNENVHPLNVEELKIVLRYFDGWISTHRQWAQQPGKASAYYAIKEDEIAELEGWRAQVLHEIELLEAQTATVTDGIAK